MENYSPYMTFAKEEWAKLRFNTPMTLTESEIQELQGVNEELSMDEVSNIYLPLTRLINLYITGSQQLHSITDTFFGKNTNKVPFIIGVAGSVAVGKSTTARIIKALLSRWPNHPKVEIITTDGYLYPNATLEKKGLMNRKGFPESYNTRALVDCLIKLKSGAKEVKVPVYSHLYYDIIPNYYETIEQPDIVIVEGINVLQTPRPAKGNLPSVFVSDFFDLSIYVDASENDLLRWYVNRFKKLRSTAFANPKSYFNRYANLSDEEAVKTATSIWNNINSVNLERNIEPTKNRADIILRKEEDHVITTIKLRKI
ncbi:type I pantothenate kinase [Salinibacillus xinjiangensis]|uniref:Pantothenate kinase n=1 Tax=Salinibacillus xinjiangensis TaxID=1229268 RepID=A0A6G1X6C6_9BACI|nr:type I pantothenate kinase [Salinibacillus xinjiangensis]MRG86492.1 type I pantothenate kinase [Salinibacillus xinjiangensis]